MNNDCSCPSCQAGCTRKPGWFKPGEAEAAAPLKGLSLQDFFNQYLAVDYWTGYPNIYLLSPAVVGNGTGNVFPSDPGGRCVFYENGLCSIHAAKPFECRVMHHDNTYGGDAHQDVAYAWRGEPQKQIVQLLGYQPCD